MLPLKLTEQLAADIRAHVKSLDFGAIEKIKKAKDDNGTFDVIISTEDTDRSGEIVKQNGWELTNYKNNPIVLWGHDYYSLPVGVCTETYLTESNGVPALGAKGVFLSAEINPFAQQVRKLYEFGLGKGAGVGCTTSVGFIPKEFDENARNTITKSELLEFSFVPIPANQGVGPAQGRSLTFAEARALGIDMAGMRTKGMTFAATLGSIPEDISDEKAAENTAWKAPALSDFTEKEWKDLSDADKREIAGHFAYADQEVPTDFKELKLAHHRASDGQVVWHGVKAAMDALLSERSGITAEDDKKAAYDHLAAHYKLFNKTLPEFKTKEAQAGDHCETDDGSEGILTSDPKDPDGPLVCLPQEQDKSAEEGNTSKKKLLTAVNDEHERHGAEIDKSFDAFHKSVDENRGERDEDEDKTKRLSEDARDMRAHLKDLRSALADEHTMHRAKSIASFRDFDPTDSKAFDKNEHLKSLRDQHDEYEAKNNKALDTFEEKCMKSVQAGKDETDEHTDSVTGKMETNQNVHLKAVTKIAKKMAKDAYGEEDQADEKTIEILKEFLAPHIDAQLLPVVAAKIGSKLAGEQKTKLGEAYHYLKAANAVLEALHGGLADGNEKESRSDSTDIGAGNGSRESRSRTRTPSHSDDALKAHIQAREIVGGIEAVAREALGKFNAEIRSYSKK
jgi:hypothetical protein